MGRRTIGDRMTVRANRVCRDRVRRWATRHAGFNAAIRRTDSPWPASTPSAARANGRRQLPSRHRRRPDVARSRVVQRVFRVSAPCSAGFQERCYKPPSGCGAMTPRSSRSARPVARTLAGNSGGTCARSVITCSFQQPLALVRGQTLKLCGGPDSVIRHRHRDSFRRRAPSPWSRENVPFRTTARGPSAPISPGAGGCP